MGRISPCTRFHAEIVRLASEGLQSQDIAARLELPRRIVQSYCARRSIRTKRGRFRVDRQAMISLLEQGLTQQQVAEALGCSRSGVERGMRSLGLKGARTGPRSGAGHVEWKGGRSLEKHGYVEVFAPLHPAARKVGRVLEHRLVKEVVLGRYLLASEVVDHRDNHPRHNWPDNLDLYASNADHLRATLTGRAKASPRSSIPGAYGNNQKICCCPSPDETLAQCPSGMRARIERHIAIHQPTSAHRDLPKSRLLRSGPHQPAFEDTSTV